MEEERREFLKKFLLLSSVPIIFNGCPNAVYGPPPSSENNETNPIIRKSIIYYKDTKGSLILLHNKSDISLKPTIIIKFPNKMSSESKAIVNLVDKKNELISCNKKWETEYILELQPIEDSLEYDSNYRLIIDETIQDKEGNLLDRENYFLVADFRTSRKNKR